MADETGYIRELSRATEEAPRYGGAPVDRRGEEEYAHSELRALRSERVEPLELRVARLEGYIQAQRDGQDRALWIGIGVTLLIATVSLIINVIAFLT